MKIYRPVPTLYQSVLLDKINVNIEIDVHS